MITVISDTHARSVEELPEELMESIEDSDVVIHAGDFDTLNVFNQLKGICKLVAVKGNCDPIDLPEFRVFEGIGVMHEPNEFMTYKAMELELDMIVFGHTHVPYLKEVKGVILLNPGSPTVPRLFPTYAVIDDDHVVVRRVGGEDLFRLKMRKG